MNQIYKRNCAKKLRPRMRKYDNIHTISIMILREKAFCKRWLISKMWKHVQALCESSARRRKNHLKSTMHEEL